MGDYAFKQVFVRFPGQCLMGRVFLVLFLLVCAIYSKPLLAFGKGPIGLWPVSERFVLLADSSLPGLVLVDLLSGVATERLIMEGANPTCVSSCPNCDFVFVTGTGGKYWRLRFPAPLAQLLDNQGDVGLNSAVLESLSLSEGGQGVSDGRICLVTNDGLAAYVASSRNRAVFRVDLSARPVARALLKTGEHEPFGLNWGGNGHLLVTMHKDEVWRVSLKGKILAKYSMSDADCPGTVQYRPNLRAAIDDPMRSDNLIVMASNPGTYDALIWRLDLGLQTQGGCSVLAGGIGPGPGWRDGVAEDVAFSRPHYLVLRADTEPAQIIVSDIDNRALRLLNLESEVVSSVMYDRDLSVADMPAASLRSALSCTELDWQKGKRAPEASNTFCLRPPAAHALQLSRAEAVSYCRNLGARLCEPAELRSFAATNEFEAWTIAQCASCWQRRAESTCSAVITTQKTPGSRKTGEFSQSWHSGFAVEIGAGLAAGPATYCEAGDSLRQAAAPCCADISVDQR